MTDPLSSEGRSAFPATAAFVQINRISVPTTLTHSDTHSLTHTVLHIPVHVTLMYLQLDPKIIII
jgi:hypothetical protein